MIPFKFGGKFQRRHLRQRKSFIRLTTGVADMLCVSLFQIFSPTESSNQNKERVASVIAHELAHQWFGNLMTLDWWNDLWLVKAFDISFYIPLSSQTALLFLSSPTDGIARIFTCFFSLFASYMQVG